jgi:hypothetical protein
MDDELGIWWEEVNTRRAAKYGNTSSGEPLEEVDQTENEYAKALMNGTAQ